MPQEQICHVIAFKKSERQMFTCFLYSRACPFLQSFVVLALFCKFVSSSLKTQGCLCFTKNKVHKHALEHMSVMLGFGEYSSNSECTYRTDAQTQKISDRRPSVRAVLLIRVSTFVEYDKALPSAMIVYPW
jgi:hypothetical protein